MAKKKKRNQHDKLDKSRVQPAYEEGVEDGRSGIAGVAGTGGSSGTGSVRAPVYNPGDVSGIDPEVDENEMPTPGTQGKGKSQARQGQLSDGGLSGRTRGPNAETVPNQTEPDKK